MRNAELNEAQAGIRIAAGAAAAAKSLQSCPTLCDPIDGSPPGSPIPGILQANNTGVGCHCLLKKNENNTPQKVVKRNKCHDI